MVGFLGLKYKFHDALVVIFLLYGYAYNKALIHSSFIEHSNLNTLW
jgi:hypothetical protein